MANETPETSYFGEFRQHWPALLGCATGLATGASLSFFTLSLFAPPMLKDMGWSRADLALVGSVPLFTLPLLPFLGRLVDVAGPRVGAGVGFAAITLCYAALASMQALWQFFAIQVFVTIFGVLTSSLCLARVIVDRFDRGRGLALSIMMSSSPVAAAAITPFLGPLIRTEGWRPGYLLLSAVCALGGIITVTLIGRNTAVGKLRQNTKKLTLAKLMELIRHPVFALFMAGMLLVNVPQQFASSQLKLIALEQGIPDNAATWMISLYATGVVVGRWLCGLALDRVRTSLVALVALGLPTAAYLAFASPITLVPLLGGAVLLMGFAQGSEGDVGAFILSRRFDPLHFSLLYGFMNMMVAAGNGLGSLTLSIMLREGHSYTPFTVICALATLMGAILFALAARTARGGLEAKRGNTDIRMDAA